MRLAQFLRRPVRPVRVWHCNRCLLPRCLDNPLKIDHDHGERKEMKKLITVLLLLSAGYAAAAEVSANVAYATDYRFRGISQTELAPEPLLSGMKPVLEGFLAQFQLVPKREYDAHMATLSRLEETVAQLEARIDSLERTDS